MGTVGQQANANRTSATSYQQDPNANRLPRPRPEIKYFTCGGVGHRAAECRPNMSREQQDRQQVSRVAKDPLIPVPAPVPAAVPAPPAQARVIQPAAYVVDVTDKELGLIYSTDPAGVMTMSTKMVELVQEEVKAVELVQEEETMASMGAYIDSLSEKERAIIVAMADKRTRPEDDGLARDAPPQQRLRTEPGPSNVPRRQPMPQPIPPLMPQPMPQPIPPLMPQPMPQPMPPPMPQPIPQPFPVPRPPMGPQVDPNVYYQPQGRPFIPDPFFERPENQYQPQFRPSATVPKTRKKPNCEPKPKRHIKMMREAKLWDPVESLRSLPVVGLDYGNLFDWAPGIRVAIAKALQMEGGNKDKRPLAQSAEICVIQDLESSQEQPENPAIVRFQRKKLKGVVDGILQEPNVRIFNFHTIGEVWPLAQRRSETAYRIGKILIDGGAVVNLMPEVTARKLNLKLLENDDIMIRTATNEIRAVRYCANFDIVIAGVTAHIRVYVIDMPQSYSLLLGRRWLYQVRAIGDYEMGSYIIYDPDGCPHRVTATNEMRVDKLLEILLNPRKQYPEELSEREKEEILIGQDKMQNIIARLVEEAAEQARELTNVELESDEELEPFEDDNEDEVEDEWGAAEEAEVAGKVSQQ